MVNAESFVRSEGEVCSWWDAWEAGTSRAAVKRILGYGIVVDPSHPCGGRCTMNAFFSVKRIDVEDLLEEQASRCEKFEGEGSSWSEGSEKGSSFWWGVHLSSDEDPIFLLILPRSHLGNSLMNYELSSPKARFLQMSTSKEEYLQLSLKQ
jgi:hypothetical protein